MFPYYVRIFLRLIAVNTSFVAERIVTSRVKGDDVCAARAILSVKEGILMFPIVVLENCQSLISQSQSCQKF